MIEILRNIGRDTDAVLARVYQPAIYVLLAFAFLLYLDRLELFASMWQGWVVADWLINFGGGFVRGGAAGEIILWLSSVTGVGANFIVMAIQASLYLAFCVLFARLVSQRQITFWYFVLCLSPLFVLFNVLDLLSIGRKELLLYVLFAAWIFVLQRDRELGQAPPLLFALLLLMMCLAHEMVAFYSPYFVFAAMLRYRSLAKGWDVAKIIPIVAFACILILSLGSGAIDQGAICARLLAAGATPEICNGILSWPVQSVSDALYVTQRLSNDATVFAFAATVLVLIVPVAAFLYVRAPELALTAVLIVLGLVLLTLPLFLLAINWGRWIHIHATLVILSFLLLLDTQRESAPTSAVAWKPAAIAGLVILASNLTWRIRHCCGEGYQNLEWGGAVGALVRLLTGGQ